MKGLPSHPNPTMRPFALPDTVQKSTWWYRFMRRACQLTCIMLGRTRVYNRHHEPGDGGVVYICNHQSFLDPVLMAMSLIRPVSFMARHSLFRFPGFKQLISSLNAFPVKRGTADVGALKEAMRRLKAGGQVLVFAEGTRTRTGHIAPLLPGVALLAQRAAAWTVPVVIDGAYEAWPRTQALPSPGKIYVCFGQPRARADIRRQDPQEFMDEVRQEMLAIQTDLRRRAGRPQLDYEGFVPPPLPKG